MNGDRVSGDGGRRRLRALGKPSLALAIGFAVVCQSAMAWGHHAAAGRSLGGSWGITGARSNTESQLSAAFTASRVDEDDARGDVQSLRLGAELEGAPWVALGLWVPVLRVAPEAERAAFGLGNVVAGGRVLLGATLPERDAWGLSLELGLPTETVRLGLDPGPVWSIGSSLWYALRLKSFTWKTQIGFSGDGRRAGLALEALAATRLSYWVLPELALGVGVLAATRVVSLCRQAGETSACDTGRASEPTTRPWDTAGRAELFGEAELAPGWALGAALRLPFTRRRDAEWSSELVVVITP